MIVEYYRPQTVDEALELLERDKLKTVPIGGGSTLDRLGPKPISVVDLQSLPLNKVQKHGNNLEIGATTSLQMLFEHPDVPMVLKGVIQQETSSNLRQVATIAGTIMAADGRSPLVAALLAMDANVRWVGRRDQDGWNVGLGDLLPVRSPAPVGKLITQVILPLIVRLAFESVARTPADLPVVCAAVAQWGSGRTRVALGGFGPAPVLAMDGPEPGGAEIAARNAYARAQDQWASAEYRSDVAGILTRRCLEEFNGRGIK